MAVLVAFAFGRLSARGDPSPSASGMNGLSERDAMALAQERDELRARVTVLQDAVDVQDRAFLPATGDHVGGDTFMQGLQSVPSEALPKRARPDGSESLRAPLPSSGRAPR